MSIKKFKRVLVVLGKFRERLSSDSGKACVKALKENYTVSTFDPQKKNLNLINKNKTDAIFNALHGKDGEDGIAQSYFEYLRIPYTHSGIISSYNSMNKAISKEIFIKNKILTPKYFYLNKNENKNKILKKNLSKKKIKFPVVIKLLTKAQV